MSGPLFTRHYVNGEWVVPCGAERLEVINPATEQSVGTIALADAKDIDRAERIADQIETGTVFMNRCDYLDPALCWTGCKYTGRGAGLSEIGYHNLTRPKSYHLKKAN